MKMQDKELLDYKIKYLEMIENIITRMANNSFLLKGWAVTLVVGGFVFVNKEDANCLLLLILPIVIFWLLDSYYLAKERSYRTLYNNVRQYTDINKIDFNLKTETSIKNWWETVTDTKMWPYYVGLVVCIGVIVVVKNI